MGSRSTGERDRQGAQILFVVRRDGHARPDRWPSVLRELWPSRRRRADTLYVRPLWWPRYLPGGPAESGRHAAVYPCMVARWSRAVTTVMKLHIGQGRADLTLACGHVTRLCTWNFMGPLPRPGTELECPACRVVETAVLAMEFTPEQIRRLRFWRHLRQTGRVTS